jgi:hypothetical protein
MSKEERDYVSPKSGTDSVREGVNYPSSIYQLKPIPGGKKPETERFREPPTTSGTGSMRREKKKLKSSNQILRLAIHTRSVGVHPGLLCGHGFTTITSESLLRHTFFFSFF